jgi:hypothetical protein
LLDDTGAAQHYAIILDDDTELDLQNYLDQQVKGHTSSSIIITLTFAPPEAADPNKGRLQVGLLNSKLNFDEEPNSIPGRIVPDKVFRRYEAEAFSISIPGADCPEELSFFIFERLRFSLKIGDTLLPHNGHFGSIRIVPTSLRHGDFGPISPIQMFTNSTSSAIRCITGNMDVTYGTLELKTETIDKGKLNPPASSAQIGADSHPLFVRLSAHDCSDSTNHKIPHLVWFYENPRTILSMQHSGHVVHTLSELGVY